MSDSLPVPSEGFADESLERIEKFQALEPGAYWRYHGKRTPEFEPRVVLLLLDVEYFDHQPHTVVLGEHPLLGKGHYKVLVKDFLEHWQFAPDGEDVRARELESLQADIAQQQAELLAGQSNPEVLGPVIAKGLLEWEADKVKEAGRNQRGGKPALAAPVAPSAGTAVTLRGPNGELRTDVASIIEQRMTTADVDQLQAMVQREAKIAEIRTGWIKERIERLSETITSMTPFFEEKSAVALARTAGVRKFADELMQGIASLDLYTGRGVEVHTLSTGADAPPEELLTIMQRKLFMDEELAAWADVAADFDFASVDRFDEQLAANPSLLEQLLPTPRCVVSMAIRRDALDYGNAWRNRANNEVNQRVFLLVRNGANVHRVHSAAESHEKAEVLFPRAGDSDELFTGFAGEAITFNDLRFTERAETAAKVALHYKRFLILLCGLDHRLQLFGRFYDEAQSLSFISLPFQQKYLRFVADAEREALLGVGRPHWRTWVEEMNAGVQSGSRVLCYYSALMTAETAPGAVKSSYYQGRTSSHWVAHPVNKSGSGVHVVYRDGVTLCVDVEVARDTWREVARKTFAARVDVSYALAHPHDDGLALLCLDRVRPDALRYYVHNRESRIAHTHFIRIFKRTLQELEREAVVEAPVRAWLRASALEAKIATETTIDELVDAAVRSWRCANRGAPLPELAEKKALGPVLSLISSLREEDDTFVTRLEDYAKERGYVPVLGALTGKHRLALYVEVPADERDERLGPWRWVRRISLSAQKNRLVETSQRFAWLRDVVDPRETELQRWPAYATWVNAGPEPYTPAALRATLTEVEQGATLLAGNFTQPGAGVDPVFFQSCVDAFQQAMGRSRRLVPTLVIAVPVLAYVQPSEDSQPPRLRQLALVEHWARCLYRFGNARQKAVLEDVYVRSYQNREHARERMQRSGEFAWCVRAPNASFIGSDDLVLGSNALSMAKNHSRKGGHIDWNTGDQRDLDEVLNRFMTNVPGPKDRNDGHYRPPLVWASPAVWTGQRSRVLTLLEATAKPAPGTRKPRS